MLEEMSEPEDPKSETNDPSTAGPDSAVADGARARAPVPPNLNASGSATESEESKPELNDPSNNGSDSAASSESLSSARMDGLTSNAPVSPELNTSRNGAGNLSIVKRRATGPRTKEGKERSKRNAVKQGIFSRVVWPDPVFDLEFKPLWRGLRDDFQPEGTLEAVLVEKLAFLIMRYRRMLIAEQAEIKRGTEFLRWDEAVREKQEATTFLKGQIGGKTQIIPGMMLGVLNPLIRRMCVERLKSLKQFIEWRGFDRDSDLRTLQMLYGDSAYYATTYCSLVNYYLRCFDASRLIEQERIKKGCPTPEECKANFIKELENQVKTIETEKETLAKATDRKERLEADCLNVPEAPRLDRLLRYEASLERAFDRTLNQLERLQRMRLRLPVPQRVELQATVSQG